MLGAPSPTRTERAVRLRLRSPPRLQDRNHFSESGSGLVRRLTGIAGQEVREPEAFFLRRQSGFRVLTVGRSVLAWEGLQRILVGPVGWRPPRIHLEEERDDLLATLQDGFVRAAVSHDVAVSEQPGHQWIIRNVAEDPALRTSRGYRGSTLIVILTFATATVAGA